MTAEISLIRYITVGIYCIFYKFIAFFKNDSLVLVLHRSCRVSYTNFVTSFNGQLLNNDLLIFVCCPLVSQAGIMPTGNEVCRAKTSLITSQRNMLRSTRRHHRYRPESTGNGVRIAVNDPVGKMHSRILTKGNAHALQRILCLLDQLCNRLQMVRLLLGLRCSRPCTCHGRLLQDG